MTPVSLCNSIAVVTMYRMSGRACLGGGILRHCRHSRGRGDKRGSSGGSGGSGADVLKKLTACWSQSRESGLVHVLFTFLCLRPSSSLAALHAISLAGLFSLTTLQALLPLCSPFSLPHWTICLNPWGR